MTIKTGSTILTAAAIACLLASAPFTATAGAQQRGRAPRENQPATPSAMGLHGYSVVLVIGDMQAAGSGDSVPSAARKALTDMQAFLPYKRYQLLDAAWMVCCGSFRSPLSGRVRGPDSGEYVYSIDTLNSTDDSKLTVRFSMRDASGPTSTLTAAGGASRSSSGGRGVARGSSAAGLTAQQAQLQQMQQESVRLDHSRQLADAMQERDEAQVLARSTRQKHEVGVINSAEMEIAAIRLRRAEERVEELHHLSGSRSGVRASAAGRAVMDSTFSIALGETVVIGTSRLKGDQALIALLTAATKPGAGR